MKLTITLAVFLTLFLAPFSYSQNASDSEISFIDSPKIKETSKKPALNKDRGNKFLSSDELKLSYAVLIFAILVLSFEVVLIIKDKVQAENSFKFIIVTLIVSSSLFLITAGYDNNQIAPAFGLFGTIAGYILGKANSQEPKKD